MVAWVYLIAKMTTTLLMIAVLVMSVVVHEVAHGYAALRLGDHTAELEGRLTLNPLKHLDWFGSVILPALLALAPGSPIIGWAKPVPYNPYNLRGGRSGPAWVAAAGPGSNLIIAVIFALFARLLVGSLPAPALAALALVVIINISLAIFNLIPVPPLDGSKILFAFLPYRWRGVENFLTANAVLGFIIVILFLGQVISYLTLYTSLLLLGPTVAQFSLLY